MFAGTGDSFNFNQLLNVKRNEMLEDVGYLRSFVALTPRVSHFWWWIIRGVYLDKLQSVTNPMHCKHVQDVLNLRGFIVMALCGGLCMTENSSTPRQGNAEDRADYSSFSALLNRVSNLDFNVELISTEATPHFSFPTVV